MIIERFQSDKERFRRETLSEIEKEIRTHMHDFKGSRDHPELVDFAARWFCENTDAESLAHFISNEVRPSEDINRSIETAFTYFVPQIMIECKKYIPKKEILEKLQAEEDESKYSLRGILRASQVLTDTLNGIYIPENLLYLSDNGLYAIAGELINRRHAISPYYPEDELYTESKEGRKNIRIDFNETVCQEIPKVLAKYEALFGINYPDEARFNERLAMTIYNFDNRFSGFWRKRILSLSNRKEQDQEFGYPIH
jgi:hypothetical protein